VRAQQISDRRTGVPYPCDLDARSARSARIFEQDVGVLASYGQTTPLAFTEQFPNRLKAINAVANAFQNHHDGHCDNHPDDAQSYTVREKATIFLATLHWLRYAQGFPASIGFLAAFDQTPGERLAGIRRERGFTQRELADKTGLIQTLVSDYERGELRLNADMILCFATALEVSTNELLQPGEPKTARKPSRKVLRRLEQIEALPERQQLTLLRTIDTFLENAALKSARRVRG
jgi:transcriptional regulator with XRE-family HTH domain